MAKTANGTKTGSAERAPQPGPGKLDCTQCNGLGYIASDVPPGHPAFGRLHVCACRAPEVQRAQDQQRLQVSSLGALANKSFDSFKPEGHSTNPRHRDSLRRALELAQRYAGNPHGWLLLHGTYGCGKTHLAAAIAAQCLANGVPVLFVTVPDLLDHLRATFSPDSAVAYDDLFDTMRNTPLLVLDDLGAESATAWAQEKLYQLVNHRYTNKLPTVITSNMDLERIDPRVRSRLVDVDLVRKVLLDAPDFRRAEAVQVGISTLDNYSSHTFENFDLRPGELIGDPQRRLAAAYAAAQRYAENPVGWLVLVGGHGTGKTHLAAAVAHRHVERGMTALFITCLDLLDHLRATFSPDSQVRYDKLFNEVRETPLLILDDLLTESATPWAREKLLQLIDHRYVKQSPTIVTMAAAKSEISERLETRLNDPRLSTICVLTCPSYKGRKPERAKGRHR